MFSHCDNLATIVFPIDSLESISPGCFSNCISLVQISIPHSVIYIGENAFSNCTKLYHVYFYDSNALTAIYNNAFEYCDSLNQITLPSALEELGEKVFYKCTDLNTIEIPNNIREIRFATFYECTSLKSVTFNGDIESIGNNAFYGCYKLSTINYYGSVEPDFADDHLSKLPYLHQINVTENYNGTTFGNIPVAGKSDNSNDGESINNNNGESSNNNSIGITALIFSIIGVIIAIISLVLIFFKLKSNQGTNPEKSDTVSMNLV